MKILSSSPFILVLQFCAGYASAGSVSQSPLFLNTSAEPNVMLMIDNSGSMTNIVPESPYDSSITYSCSNANVIPGGSSVEIRISSGPRIYYDGNHYTWESDRCFDPSSSYDAKLYADDGTTPSGYLGADYSGNYLNWYFNAGNTSPVWTSQQKKPGTSSRLEIAKPAAKTLIDTLQSVRLGLATYNDSDGGKLLEVVDDLSSAKKSIKKTKIDAITSSGATPLAETLSDIGRYFTTGYSGNLTLHPESSSTNDSIGDIFNNHSINNSSGVSPLPAPIQYSCQKSFAIMMTDGRSQSDQNISSVLADYDGDCSSGGAGCGSYDRKPSPVTYESNGSDYLDDVAQALFEMDLRPDLEDSFGGKNNLVTYTVGFADLNVQNDPLIQEAATQGGGQFYFAENAAELSASLSSVFAGIAEQAVSSASSVATNSTRFQSDSLVYQATFNSQDWGGHLLALELTTEDSNGNGTLDAGEDINGNGKIDAGNIGNPVWDAASRLPAAAARKIYSYNPAATGTKGIEFLWANLNTAQSTALGSENMLNYLRGDQTLETSSGGSYRDRTSLLGDIVNSSPLFVGRNDYGYAILPGAEGYSYSSFATTPRRVMIYAGANDGMLHGFDASQGTDGGKEIFAYLPNSVISAELVSLSSPSYTHRYFVDGTAQAGDAYYGAAWHTVLIGSTGAGNTTAVASGTDLATGTGGRAVFALDITDPDAFSADKVLWEFSSRDDADLGYTIPEASIVRMANGQWAAIVANGYNSAAGKAALFIINIQDGSIIRKIEAETATGSNGLSSPVAVDLDSDQIVDYIYAGDLKGNMWKFDVTDASESNWAVAYGGSPLYIATDNSASPATQPITSKPAVAKASATGQTSGVMVYFGTGKYFETGDEVASASSQIQSFYSIWDVCDKNTPMSCYGPVSGRSYLQEQGILFEGSAGTTTLADGTTVVNQDIRVTSQCEVAFDSSVPGTTTSPCTGNINRRGWFIDLVPPSQVAQGERIVTSPILRNGRVIFTTLIPITDTCIPGGTGWLMELDQYTGARLDETPFDLSGDEIVDATDQVLIDDPYNPSGPQITVAASGIKSKVGIIKTPAIIECESGLDCKYVGGSSGSIMELKETIPGGGGGGGGGGASKRSWIQLR